MPYRRIALVLACVLLVLALAGCGGSAPAPTTSSGGSAGAGTTTVVEKGFAFDPSNVTVKVGDTVVFENQDSAPHDVSIDGQDLGQQTQGQKVEWKATKAGTFPFNCTIHPSMTGQVTVQ